MKIRLVAWILAAVLVVGLFPTSVRAFSPDAANGDWKYELTDGGICLTAYLGSEDTVTVPAILDGQRVSAIGSGCFKDNADLREVTIEHGIRVIGIEAFYGCSNLKKVHISGSVNKIGARAFAHTGIGSVVIPGSVSSVGEEAFRGCEKLYNVVIEEGVEDWFSIDIGDDFGSGSVTLVEGIETLGDKAFYDCINLTRMRVPATVTAIGSKALGYTADGVQSSYQITGFAGSEADRYANANGISFKTVEPGDGKSGICGEEVLWSFDGATLTISGTGRMYDYASAEYLPWYALRGQITGAVVEEGVTSLGEYLFSGSAVSHVTLPTTLEAVGKEAFGSCASLEEITFPGNAPEFAENAFLGTTLTAWYPQNNTTWTTDVRKDYGGDVTWLSEEMLPFVDVPKDSFFYDPVAWAVKEGITTGTSETTFNPDGECQRAVVVTFLWRAAGSPEPTSTQTPFTDVKKTDFFYKAVLWAVENGITNGMSASSFGPYVLCNRAQVVTFLYRTMDQPAYTNTVNPFSDVDVTDFYGDAVLWAVENGITNGMGNGKFGINEICNRAQVVTFLYRTLVN